jgi:hypothetical protein
MTGLLTNWKGLPTDERKARLRSLQAITRCCCGPSAKEFIALLRSAENDDAALPLADAAMLRLHGNAQRRILCTFAHTLPTFREPKRRQRKRAGEVAATFREAARPGRNKP